MKHTTRPPVLAPLPSIRTPLTVLLVCLAIMAFVPLCASIQPYGDQTTLNAGIVAGSDCSIGFETRGNPGLFVDCGPIQLPGR